MHAVQNCRPDSSFFHLAQRQRQKHLVYDGPVRLILVFRARLYAVRVGVCVMNTIQSAVWIEDIKRTTASTEEKLTALMDRLSDVEARLEFLESAETDRQNNPLATKEDLKLLWDKIEDMENRSRRNNVRFVGIPEGKEREKPAEFIEKLLANLLGMEKRCEVERAHRVPTQQPPPGSKPRTILARFLKSSDRDLVLRTARMKKELIWESHRIMLFPDYSRATQQRRDKFKDCKKILHERQMSFRLLFPAKLIVNTKEGPKTFDCPRKAMSFIEATP
ncbi:hypothetical protein WMY93_007084 [Mugilogobius chulae]|uniref:L1 transposable element RRM domain-containing protein n=1 Tax=Mugilogobius chulae TaxID=88201 RepID=A0AAW0PQ40_9GOBI